MPKESIYFLLPELSESHNPKEIKKAVGAIHGVISVSVNAKTKMVAVDFDNSGTTGEKIAGSIEKAGFSPQITERQEHIM